MINLTEIKNDEMFSQYYDELIRIAEDWIHEYIDPYAMVNEDTFSYWESSYNQMFKMDFHVNSFAQELFEENYLELPWDEYTMINEDGSDYTVNADVSVQQLASGVTVTINNLEVDDERHNEVDDEIMRDAFTQMLADEIKTYFEKYPVFKGINLSYADM